MWIEILNGFSCSFNGMELPLKSMKAKAIIGHTVLSDDGVSNRESLKALLWSESSEKRAQDSLRRALLDIRHAFKEIGFSHFGTKRESFFIDLDHVGLDIGSYFERFETLVSNPANFGAIRSFESMLIGFDRVDPAFADWLRTERSARHRQTEDILQNLLKSDQCKISSLVQIARLLLELNPTDEQACNTLIRCHVEAGDSEAVGTGDW